MAFYFMSSGFGFIFLVLFIFFQPLSLSPPCFPAVPTHLLSFLHPHFMPVDGGIQQVL